MTKKENAWYTAFQKVNFSGCKNSAKMLAKYTINPKNKLCMHGRAHAYVGRTVSDCIAQVKASQKYKEIKDI